LLNNDICTSPVADSIPADDEKTEFDKKLQVWFPDFQGKNISKGIGIIIDQYGMSSY